MSDLPKGWTEVRLGDLFEITSSKRVLQEEWKTSGVPFYRAREIKQLARYGYVQNDLFISEELFLEYADRFGVPAAEDLMVTAVGTLGECYRVQKGDRFYFKDASVIWLRNALGIYSEFVRRLFLVEEVKAQVHRGGGTTVGTYTIAAAKGTKIPFPPLPEQRRIVAKLDRLSARSRAARDHLARTTTLVARAKQAILAAAFRGDLTFRWRAENRDAESAADLVARTPEPEQSRGGRNATDDITEGVGGIAVNDPGTPLPEGWAWTRLRRIARQETGHTPSRSHPEWWGGEVPWIGIKDANRHHGRVIEETLQNINEDGLANSSARLLPAGTVCLSRTASVGYVTVMGRPMATSQDFATWTCTDALDPFYLMYALMSEGEDIRRFGEGSTHTTIYFPEIRAFQIKLAPIEEQREIVRRIESAFARIDRLTEEAGRAAHLLDRLDERLLARAFRGKLVPQDPADEPAAHLLARIRAARTAAPKPRRTRRRRSSDAV